MEKIRLKDIAESLGLSVATVSNVLNGKEGKVSQATRARVLEAVEGSGYLPERAEVLLGRNPSRMVGLVVNDHPEYEGTPLEDPYIARFISFLQKAVSEQGLELLVKTAVTWEEAARFASMWNMQGLVVTGFCEADYASLKHSLKIPLAACDAFDTFRGFSSISVEDHKGGQLAGEHLKRLGHRRVLCLTTNLICNDLARIEGIRSTGLQADVFLISPDSAIRHEQLQALDLQDYTAVFCVSDRQALELLSVLHQRGIRVPEDLSVIGFDGIAAGAYAVPPLTTISQDMEAKARMAVEALFSEPAIYPVDVTLTERSSTAYAKDIL